MVAPSGSGIAVPLSTLPSRRSIFSGTAARFSMLVMALCSVRQVASSSNSGLHQRVTASICG